MVLSIEFGDSRIRVGLVVAKVFFGLALTIPGGDKVVPIVDLLHRGVGDSHDDWIMSACFGLHNSDSLAKKRAVSTGFRVKLAERCPAPAADPTTLIRWNLNPLAKSDLGAVSGWEPENLLRRTATAKRNIDPPIALRPALWCRRSCRARLDSPLAAVRAVCSRLQPVAAPPFFP